MIEDVLAEFASEGFVVSNTFQTVEGDWAFGPTGWKVYIRNVRNTRTGIGEADTLEGALRVALNAARQGPTYERPQRPPGDASPKRRDAPSSPVKVPILGSPSDETSEELF
jgi:hypothetical protein